MLISCLLALLGATTLIPAFARRAPGLGFVRRNGPVAELASVGRRDGPPGEQFRSEMHITCILASFGASGVLALRARSGSFGAAGLALLGADDTRPCDDGPPDCDS
jgi:hypothetical protein